MADDCIVNELVMQQQAVAAGGNFIWGMNYNSFSLGCNILLFIVFRLASPQSFVVARKRKKRQTLKDLMQIHLFRVLRLTCGKAVLHEKGLENLPPHNSSQETINCYGIFALAGASPLRPRLRRTLCTRKTHVSPCGFPGERFTNHSFLVSANKADSFEIVSAGILRQTPFHVAPPRLDSLTLPLSRNPSANDNSPAL